MESRKFLKKGKRHDPSLSSSLESPGTCRQHQGEEDREETSIVCQRESHLHCMKNRMEKSVKSKEKHRKKKKKQKSAETEGLSEPCRGSENVHPLRDRSNQSGESGKRGKRQLDLTQSYSSKKKHQMTQSGQKNARCMEKGPNKNHETCHHHLVGDPTLHNFIQDAPSQKNISTHDLECALDGSQCGRFRMEQQLVNSPTRALKIPFTPKDAFGSYNEKDQQDPGVTNNHIINKISTKASTKCMAHGRSSFTANTLIPENDRDASLERSPKLDDLGCVSDYSQDLFVTQKTYQPVHTTSSTSWDSPPPGQKPACHKHKSRQDPVQKDSQISAFTEKDSGGSTVYQCPFEPISVNTVKLSDKTTQTEGLFSYLSLMSILKSVKPPETCPEEPLDLSLPGRARAADSNAVINTDDDVILVSVKPSTVQPSPAAAKRPGKLSISQLHEIDGKFVQTLLNASYFFKGKYESDSQDQVMPILKQKAEHRKCSKKTAASRHKKQPP